MNRKVFRLILYSGTVLVFSGCQSSHKPTLPPETEPVASLSQSEPATKSGTLLDKIDVSKWEVGLIDGGDLYLADAFGKKKKLLAKKVDNFLWSVDGKQVALNRDTDLWLLDLGTMKERLLESANIPPKNSEEKIAAPRTYRPVSFDPLRPVLVCTDEKDILLVDIAPGHDDAPVQILERWDMVEDAASWSPKGDQLAVTRNGDIWLALRGADKDSSFDGIDADYYLQANRLASVAFFNDVPRGSSIATPYWAGDLAWTADQKKLVFGYYRYGGSGVADIGYVDLKPIDVETWDPSPEDTVKVTWLTIDGDALHPQICPDGKTLSFVLNNRDNHWNWVLSSWDGKHQRLLIKENDSVQWRPQKR